MAEGFITRRGGKGGIDVSDANAVQSDVLQGKTFYSGDENIKTGTIPSKSAQTFTPTTTNQTIAANQFLSGTQTILGDSDLVPNNIRDGTTIFGVTGTLEEPLGTYLSFDGVDDFVNIGQLTSLFGGTVNSFAFELDFLSTQTTLGSLFGFVNTGPTSIIALNANRSVTDTFKAGSTQFIVRDQNNNIEKAEITTNLYDGVRRVLKVEYKNNTMNFFINGNPISIIQGNNENPNPNNITLGFDMLIAATNARGTIENFVGMELYNFKIFINDVIALEYGFTEGSGTTLNDSVGNNDGTIVGATW